MSDRLWRVLLLAGIVVRVALALLASNSTDLAFYVQAADDGAQRAPMYESETFSYPPLWGYFFALAGRALVAMHVPLIVHERVLDGFVVPRLSGAYLATPLAALALKLPAFVVDAALAELLYHCGLASYGRAVARRLALAWWLNPLPIVVGGVQASWDSVVPLSMIFAIVSARQGRYVVGGGALAAGIVAKLAPLYLVFLLPALLRGAGLARGTLRNVLAAGAGAGAVLAVALFPILVWRELGALRTAIFARGETFVLGGANLFAFAGLASARSFDDWALAHRGSLSLALSLASLAGCCAIAVFCYRRRPFTLADAFVGAFGLVTVLLLTSPFVQPTYIIWLLPFALFLAAGGDRVWRAIAGALTVFALGFYLTVRAVQALLEPACLFFRLCDPASFGAASVRYANTLGLGSSTLQVSLDVVFGELLCVTLLFAGAYCFDLLSRPEPSGPDAVPAASSGMKRQAVVAAALVVVACGSAVAPGPPAVRVQLALDGRRAVVTANGYDGDLHVVVGDGGRRCAEIDAYGDERYPSLRGVTATFSAGLPIHLRNDLRVRGLRPDVRTVDAHALALLLRRAPGGRCLLVLGGVLPRNVRDRNLDLLEPWLLAGGVAFWAGGPFDVISAQPRSDSDAAPFRVVSNDWPGLFGNRGNTVFPDTANPFAPPVEHAVAAAPAWGQSRIGFDRTTFPLNAGPLERLGGEPLAYLDGRFNSSVSSLPLGHGRLVFFGDAFDDELAAAETIAQLVYCGTWSAPRYARVVDRPAHGDARAVVAGLRGGDSVRVFGDRFGGGPFAMADVPGRVRLSFAASGGRAGARSAVISSPGFAGGVVADVRAALSHDVRRLLVYRDDRYPAGRGSPHEFVGAVAAALSADEEIQARGITVAFVDANALRDALRRPPATDALVVLGGVLPATVRAAGYDLLKPWIERGGLAIWAGGPFDVVYARPGPGSYARAHLDPPDYGPWPNLYGKGKVFPAGVDPYRPPRRRGDGPSPAWPVWQGGFRMTTFALNAGPLAAAGGTPLGYLDGRADSSVSTLPLGRGRVVFFADSFDDADAAADDIARLMLTGAWDGDWRAVRVRSALVTSHGTPLALAPVPPGSDVIVFGARHDDVAPILRKAPEN